MKKEELDLRYIEYCSTCEDSDFSDVNDTDPMITEWLQQKNPNDYWCDDKI